ncbi:nitroreductase family protein [Lentzea jiangxiensis]|uniref:Putative TM nitroreductase n=1 Tax=Lentzea jiangxiensis TaxID=641025 RepID=A0A1H0KXR5_9PSEU|nr:nitroreductase family protein [Lentzea jiangxiensis]SDO60757.1 Putative TM nitroreductase [Lentzea jiangxiensis]
MAQVTAALGLGPEQIEKALVAASLAPSVHNTQPWRFEVRRDRIELHPDPGRKLAATDPENRELRLSCGAALFNLRLALQSMGVRPLVSMLPGHDAPGALAVVRRGGTVKIDDEHRLRRALGGSSCRRPCCGWAAARRSRPTPRRPVSELLIGSDERQSCSRA